jgi:hypothetical protein
MINWRKPKSSNLKQCTCVLSAGPPFVFSWRAPLVTGVRTAGAIVDRPGATESDLTPVSMAVTHFFTA